MQGRILTIALAVALVLASLALPGPVGAASGVSVAPQAGAPGTQFVITGAGLVPDTGYNVLVERGQVYGQTIAVTTDARGAFNLTFDSTGLDEGTGYSATVLPAGGGNPVGDTKFAVEGNQPERCFTETGFCVRGRFLAYWEQSGGVPIHGFPLSDEFSEVLENGQPYVVQYFERNRLEYHPESNEPQSEVLLGQFGLRIRPSDPRAGADPAMVYFLETGHNVPNDFYAYWAANGGLSQFGYPTSEPFMETIDGAIYRVQYFERARFEYHPENPMPYDILLGQFGRMILAEVVRP